MEWNGGMDWTGMEWNDRSTNFVGDFVPGSSNIQRSVLERVWSTIATVL